MPASAPPPARANASVLALFKKHFGYTPAHHARAPGRIELLGHHTEPHGGVALSAAIDRYVHVACGPRTDGKIELVSSAATGAEKFWITELRPNPAAAWADPIKGVLIELRKRGVHFSGFNAAIHSDIPVGAGLGETAALTVATALAVRQLHPFSLGDSGATLPPRRDERGRIPPLTGPEKMHFAKLCPVAVNEFGGERCGRLAPLTVLYSRAWHALAVDCRHYAMDHASLIGEAIVICESGMAAAPSAADAAALAQRWDAAARELGVASLRAVELKQLQAVRDRLEPRAFECAYHVVGEIARVVAGERALREDDHRQFGQYLFQSHESARDFLRNSTAELDLLVALARTHRGCLGARLSGSGWGGATLNLVAHHEVQNFIVHMAQGYERTTGIVLKPFVCQLVDGAG